MRFSFCFWLASTQAVVETQQHYVRGTVVRVSESSATIAGGPEDDSRGSATPRVSGDGTKVVFYSDGVFSADGGFEENNDYHIWMADVSGVSPFPKSLIYNHRHASHLYTSHLHAPHLHDPPLTAHSIPRGQR